jgi:hypothetical protein
MKKALFRASMFVLIYGWKAADTGNASSLGPHSNAAQSRAKSDKGTR